MEPKPAFNSPEDLTATTKPAIQAHSEFKTIVSPGSLVGTWVNIDSATRGIVKIVVAWSGSHLTVHTFGACTPTHCDWGSVNGMAYGDTVSSTTADAFSALYSFTFKDTLLTAELQRAVLAVDTFNHFKDSSGRSDYHTREYFRHR